MVKLLHPKASDFGRIYLRSVTCSLNEIAVSFSLALGVSVRFQATKKRRKKRRKATNLNVDFQHKHIDFPSPDNFISSYLQSSLRDVCQITSSVNIEWRHWGVKKAACFQI